MSKYYTSRPLPKGYCEEYWQESKVDPDGVTRNRLKERALAKDDYQEELAFIKKLRPGTIVDVVCGLGHFLS